MIRDVLKAIVALQGQKEFTSEVQKLLAMLIIASTLDSSLVKDTESLLTEDKSVI